MKGKSKEEEGKAELVKRTDGLGLGVLLFSVLVAILLVVTCFSSAGLVRAEEEQVETGNVSVDMNPEISDFTYTTDDVLYKQNWDSAGDWTISDENVSGSEVSIGGGDNALIDSDDAKINTTSDSLYVESRVKLDESGDGTKGKLLTTYTDLDDGTDAEITIESLVSGDGTIKMQYSNDTEGNTYLGGIYSGDDFDKGRWYRCSITVTDSDLTSTFYHDNYTEMGSLTVNNYTGNPSCFTDFAHDPASGQGITYDYFYTSTGTTPTADYQAGDDTELSPEDSYERKQEIDLDDSNFYGESGNQDINSITGYENNTPFESRQYVTGKESINMSAITPEEGTEPYEKDSMYVGWKNLQDTIEDNLIDKAAKEEGVDKRFITMIDYRLSDIKVTQQFNQDMVENIREEYADEILETAKDKGWKLNVSGVTNGYESVDTIMSHTDMQCMEVNGHLQFGAGKIQNTQLSIGGHQVGSAPKFTVYDQFKGPSKAKAVLMGGSTANGMFDFLDDPSDSIESGASWALNFGQKITENQVTNNWQNIWDGARDRSVGGFAFGTETIGDIQSSLSDNIVSDTFERTSEIPGKMVQFSNQMIASTLESAGYGLNQAMNFTESGVNGLTMSLAKAGTAMNSLLNSTANNFLNNLKKAGSLPFNMVTNNPITKMITYTIIIGIAVIIIAAVAMVWKGSGAFDNRG